MLSRAQKPRMPASLKSHNNFPFVSIVLVFFFNSSTGRYQAPAPIDKR